jgi:hypothetical protein
VRSIRVSLQLTVLVLLALCLVPKETPYDSAGIAFLGDSITLGMLASSRSNTFVSLVTQGLDRRGVDEKARLFISVEPDRDLSAASQAMKKDRHIVVIEFGVHATEDEQISPDEFRQIYTDLLDCVVGGEEIVVVGTVPWLGWAPDGAVYARAEQFSQIIAEEAAKRQVAVADLWSATKLRTDLISTPQDYAFLGSPHGDGFHPGDAGHAVIAQVYEKALSGELANPPKRPYQRQCH